MRDDPEIKGRYIHELIQTAAVAVAAVEDLLHGTTQIDETGFGLSSVLDMVYHERQSQERKWGPQHHEPPEWITILGEEFGEAAREAFELCIHTTQHDHSEETP